MVFLYEEIETIKKYGSVKTVPDYILNGLSSNIKLRDYQFRAIENFLLYTEGPASKNKQIWTLFHMATGSGKTLIMATLILYFYFRGYRNFIFFVKNINIIDKTIENLTNSLSKKYLFAHPLEIDGKIIRINQVYNFQNSNPDSINICFTSNAGLQNSLGLLPSENSLSKSDFEDDKVVMIADESHHLNAQTKDGHFIFEDFEDSSWESTVMGAFRANKDNVLLEFTATCDIKNPFVQEKYKDVIVFDYPLSKFREEKYSKDIVSLPSTDDLIKRAMIAILISQYRYKLFQENKLNIKPIIMFKSKSVSESNDFYNSYINFLSNVLSDLYLTEIKESNSTVSIINEMFDYFEIRKISLQQLVQEIKLDFADEHCISLNSKKGKISREDATLLNSLEDQRNPYRVIFVVDMLNEGWDVLNLFDIVRLYDTRDGKWTKSGTYIPGKTTITEQQLIGRGARYYPFKIENWQEENLRKYDSELDNHLRICETLVYHCTTDNRYITEIKAALRESGLVSKVEPTKIELRLKEQFKSEYYYNFGYILVNERIEKNRNDIKSLPEKLKIIPVEHTITPSAGSTVGLFDVESVRIQQKKSEKLIVRNLPINLLLKGIRQFPALRFNKLKNKFPNLKSIEEFLTDIRYLGNMVIMLNFPIDYNYSYIDLLNAFTKLCNEVSTYISKIEVQYQGTMTFKEQLVTKYVKDIVTYREIQSGARHGEGVSQSVDDQYRFDLSKEEWYVYNDNYGTSEEKSFVRYFAGRVEDFKKEYSKIFLIRNEQQFGIYSFSSGERFEPDFILVLANENKDKKMVFFQIFIEPKGSQFIGYDGTFSSGNESWKERFLSEIVELKIEHKIFFNDDLYRIWGLPFYNEAITLNDFDEKLNQLLNMKT